MALLLFTGGIHSGKSRLAQTWAEHAAPERLFAATCLAGNGEMKARAARRQKSRGPSWELLVEPLNPGLAIKSRLAAHPPFQGAIMLDSLGAWIDNLMAQNMPPAAIMRQTAQLAAFFSGLGLPVAVVTEECGCGGQPAAAIAGKFAGILGTANQIMAKEAQAAIFAVCGLPLALKGELPACLLANGEKN